MSQRLGDANASGHASRMPRFWRAVGPRTHRGQALAEFAIVVPIVIAILGGIIQFGVIFWAQNTLTQVVRDTGRWAATQQTSPCNTGTVLNSSPSQSGTQALVAEANSVAATSSLLGYTTNEWSLLQDFTVTAPPPNATPDASIAAAPNVEGIYVAWVNDAQPATGPTQSCPPTTNAAVWHVTIRINHSVPVFLPGLQYLPGVGTCGANGCHLMLSSTAQFRMEPAPLGLQVRQSAGSPG